jgi:hypothetical protein
MLGTVFADEARQGVDGGETLIAGCNAAVTTSLKISQKCAHLVGGEIIDRESIDLFMQVARHERQ